MHNRKGPVTIRLTEPLCATRAQTLGRRSARCGWQPLVTRTAINTARKGSVEIETAKVEGTTTPAPLEPPVSGGAT